jgi:hypothetical protein
MDVKRVFLNCVIKEEVYVQQASGFIIAGQEEKVLRLRKALYGLRQAPRAWNVKLDDTLVSLSFHKSISEHGVYTRRTNTDQLVLDVYVDGLIITGTSSEAIIVFKAKMEDMFQMSNIGLLSYYLGIEFRQSKDGIFLCQKAYTGKLLERCGLGSCNPTKSPIESRLKLSKQSKVEAVNTTENQSIVGALWYLLHTRPDLAFLVGYLSWFMEEPRADHLTGVKHVLRYIAGTRGHGLHYTKHGGGESKLIGYSDADMADDVDTRKSTSSIIFFLSGNPITWQSCKQRVVALSSCETEYVMTMTAACQAV